MSKSCTRRSHLSLATGIADHKVDHLPIRKESSSPSLSYRDPYEDDFDVSPKMVQLTETHKTAIRLDVILGKVGSKRKDVYDSKHSLASKIDKVERSVEDIESKLDLLIDLYKEDRKPLLQHCQDCSQQNNMPAEHNQTEVTSCLKNPIISKPTAPCSILSDKHCSEPTSPTNARTPDKKMQRNLSDLSQRIKKRVTYRLLSLNDQSSLVKQNPSGPK
uniref:Potassium voltage-gated channel subfamily KQT member 5 n=1 Tax=Magallana gigas TaxID=29159 RepID=A0A8W8NB43_MAGGI